MSIKSIAQNMYVVGEILTTLKGWNYLDHLWRYVEMSHDDDVVVFVDLINRDCYEWIVGISSHGKMMYIAPYAIKGYDHMEFERS